jgi:uncharacterized membrane protein HdeD (DUF308 family)
MSDAGCSPEAGAAVELDRNGEGVAMLEGTMLEGTLLEKKWGWVAARGAAGILFGAIALARPGATWFTLIMLFAVFAFFEGIANVISAAVGSRAGEPRWGTLLVEGLLSIAVAVLAVMSPARMSLALVWLIGFWAILTGGFRIASAIRLRKVINHEWAMGLAGAAGIIFGLLLLFRPVAGALALIWWLGAYAIVFGAMMLVVGFRLRHLKHLHESGSGGAQLPTGGLPAAR